MIKFFVALHGESLNEAKQYLEHNANSIDTRFIGISSTEDMKGFNFLVECKVEKEGDLKKLHGLRDLKIFQ